MVGRESMMKTIDSTFFSMTPRHTVGLKSVICAQIVLAELTNSCSEAPLRLAVIKTANDVRQARQPMTACSVLWKFLIKYKVFCYSGFCSSRIFINFQNGHLLVNRNHLHESVKHRRPVAGFGEVSHFIDHGFFEHACNALN